MSSKAQGLSLNTIVIAAIVLVVLLLLVGMTTGYFGSWRLKFGSASATSCSEVGGTPTTGDCELQKQVAGGFFEDVKEGQKCCFTKACGSELGAKCKSPCSSADRVPAGDWSCQAVGGVCCKNK